MPAQIDRAKAIARFLGCLTGRGAPLAVYWRITHRCNAACAYCGVRERDPRELSGPELLALMREARRAGMYRVNLSGGEPLLREDFGDIVSHLKRDGVSVGVDTNGILVAERLEELRRVDSVTLSLDGGEATHDHHRGRGSFARTIRAAEHLHRAGIRLLFSCVITPENYRRLDEVLECARAFKTRALFQPATPWKHASREPNPLAPSVEQVREALAFLERRRAHGDAVANAAIYFQGLRDFPRQPRLPCPGGRIACVVDADGRLGCCDYGVVADAWRDPRERGFAEAFARLPKPPACNQCLCANAVLLQHAIMLHPQALWHLWRSY